ncbi:MAG: hypothetical protein WC728_02200 [Elusimicrobiota bacterium]
MGCLLASFLLLSGPARAAGPDALSLSYAGAAAALRQPGGPAGLPAVGEAGPAQGADERWLQVAVAESKSGKKPPYPDGASVVDQLRWWDRNYSSVTTFFYSWLWVPNIVSSTDINAAARRYHECVAELGGRPNAEQKVQLLIRVVRERFRGTDNVCRHHAALFYYTARQVGLSDVELRQFVSKYNFRDDGGHCWNRITIDGRRFVVSSDWETYYEDS